MLGLGLTKYWVVYVLDGITAEEYRRKRALRYHNPAERDEYLDWLHTILEAMPVVGIGTSRYEAVPPQVTLPPRRRNWQEDLADQIGADLWPVEQILTDERLTQIDRMSVVRFRDQHRGRLAFLMGR